MKPNFALSLSFQGIRLLLRAAGGWRVVGEVALDAVDMAGELAVLRRTATALVPGGLRSKLLLPEEQVKFLTIDTPDMDDAGRRKAARAALDGATPYEVDELAFDISVEGTRTHIAAVARETLAEAEAFAEEHRFYPISFAAIPGDNAYLGEPFFGPTKAAAALLGVDETVEPDRTSVVVIGDLKAIDDSIAAPANAPGAFEPDQQAVDQPEPLPDQLDTSPTLSGIAPEPVTPVTAVNPERVPVRPVSSEPEPVDALRVSGRQVVGSRAQAESVPPTTMLAAKEAPPESKKLTIVPSEAPGVGSPATMPIEQMPAVATSDPDPLTASIPKLPSLGAASRIPPAPKDTSPAVPSGAAPTRPIGFASKRGAQPSKGRMEPIVAASFIPATTRSPAPADALVLNRSVPPAPPQAVAPDSSSLTPEPTRAAAPTGRFLSRRKAKSAALRSTPVTMAGQSPPTPRTEAERMTIFGARRNVGGKPKFLGLILTAALLVFLAGVAAWASVFLDDGLSLSRLFGDRAPREAVHVPEPQVPEDPPEEVLIASISPTLSEEDAAVLDALSDPVPPPVVVLTPEEFEARYAATGIWPIAPTMPPEPVGLINIDDLYLTSIDPISTAIDAVALPTAVGFATDLPMEKVVNPAAAGTVFVLDGRGLVVPTAQGAASPDGYTVYLGQPPLIPPPTPTRFQAEPEDSRVPDALAGFRPKNRPGNLTETNERANLDGMTRSELADLRPRLRPGSVQQRTETEVATLPPAPNAAQAIEAALATPEAQIEAAPQPFVNVTRLAATASARPDTRPRNFARIVKRAKRTPAPQAETRVARSASIAPRVVTPKIPSKNSVAKQATVKNAINLRKVNLIGVYGKPSNRRALVRLANGRYKKVVVGDQIDGGKVSAIGDSELRYVKRGRNVVLKMPKG